MSPVICLLQVGDDQQLEDSTSQSAKETTAINVKDLFCIDLDLGNEEEALSAAGLSGTDHKDYQADEDGNRKGPGMHFKEQQ